MKKILGIDIGGTKVSCLLVTSAGRALAERTFLTRSGDRAKALSSVRELLSNLSGLFKEQSVKLEHLEGIGICLPGPVNGNKGLAPWSPNMKGWEGLPLKKMIRQKFPVPVKMANDANAAALGEKFFGAGKQVNDLVYITVSTGIGGGIVLGGKVHSGASFSGGEIGHMCIVPNGNPCNCGMRGCLEAYASGTAIGKAARQRVRKNKERGRHILKLAGGAGSISAMTVSKAARAGDPLARQILAEAGHYLGIGIANIINILNPEMISLGGSVINAGALLWKPMIMSVKINAWPVAFKACRIIKTKLGSRVGNLGAAALVISSRP